MGGYEQHPQFEARSTGLTIAESDPLEPGAVPTASRGAFTGSIERRSVRAASAPAAPLAVRPIPIAVAPIADRGGLPVIYPDRGEPPETNEATDRAVRAAPPWLISAIVHMAVLILMGVLYFTTNHENKVRLKAIYAEDEGVQLVEDILQDPAKLELSEIADPVLSRDVVQVLDPLAAPPQLDLSLDGMTAVSDLLTPSIGLALTGREKGAREALLGAYGGNATTEGAVQLGLEWLVQQQDRRSGLWSLKGPYADASVNENEVSATAMALLALQGNGNTHKVGKFSQSVQRGAEALVRMQDQDGNMFHEGVANHRLYSQAQATIALCELYGMTKDPRYRQPAQKALDYASKIQSPQGGWRYTPREDSDTSVTGWFVMAMQSGLMAGLTVQSPTLDAIGKYLDSATPDGSFYSYQARGEPTLPMTAEALLCRQYLGWPHDDPRLRTGIDYVLKYPVDYNEQDLYYWYYATQVMHHMGGRDWDAWNKIMRREVPANQVQAGRERGSWDPSNDRWGLHGGRLYTTCLSIFLLEVYYRHLPIYQHFNLPASIISSAQNPQG